MESQPVRIVLTELHSDKVKRQISENELRKMLVKAAFSVEARTKINITDNGQIDTGFMRNSVYVSGLHDTYSRTDQDGEYKNKAGETVKRFKAPRREPSAEGNLVVGVAAVYAYYQEQRKPFLMPALEEVQREFGG